MFLQHIRLLREDQQVNLVLLKLHAELRTQQLGMTQIQISQ